MALDASQQSESQMSGFFQETTTSPRMILQVSRDEMYICIYVIYMYISYHNSISLMLQ